MKTDVFFKSQKCRWNTPQWLFNALNKEFGFQLDVCADPDNALCEKFYTADDDGLLMPWSAVNWCNPPYGNRIHDWLNKAVREQANGKTTIVLIPARTDTKWFHEFALNRDCEIRFIKGRLRFSGATANAPFPSMLLIYHAH